MVPPRPRRRYPKLDALLDALIRQRGVQMDTLASELHDNYVGQAVKNGIWMNPDTSGYVEGMLLAAKNNPGSYQIPKEALSSNANAYRWAVSHEVGHTLQRPEEHYRTLWDLLMGPRDKGTLRNQESEASAFATAMTTPNPTRVQALARILAFSGSEPGTVKPDVLPPRAGIPWERYGPALQDANFHRVAPNDFPDIANGMTALMRVLGQR